MRRFLARRRYGERLAWWLLVKAARLWSLRYMDQFEHFKFSAEHGVVYVSLSLKSPWPDSFDAVDRNGRAVCALGGAEPAAQPHAEDAQASFHSDR